MSDPDARRLQILDAAVPVIGHFGLRRTSIADLARAAGISKQGLYLHFDSKDALIAEGMERYFREGLRRVEEALAAPGQPLQARLVEALDAWFGRHYLTFNPASLEVLDPASPGASGVDAVKARVIALLEGAIAASPDGARHPSPPQELAQVLFQYGLTWKEGHPSHEALRASFERCVRAVFPPTVEVP